MGLINLFRKYENRPRIKIAPTAFDIIIDGISFVLLLLMLFAVFQNYADLPNLVPSHFGADGLADEYGNKMVVWLLPSIGILIFIGSIILNNFPHKFNYLVAITKENAKQQYAIGTRIVRFSNLFVMAIFFYISNKTINIALQKSEASLNAWFSPIIIILILVGLVAVVIFSVLKNKKGR